MRFASLVYLLPFHHPIRLAEEICSLDHLLGGRFDVGVGRGISPPEHELWGLESDRARENFDETLAVLRQALTTDSLTFHGKKYHFDELPIVLRPYQQPTPPFWYAGNIARGGGGDELRGGINDPRDRPAGRRVPGGLRGGRLRGNHDRRHPHRVRRTHRCASSIKGPGRVARVHRSPPAAVPAMGARADPDPTLGGDVDRALELGVLIAGSPATVREQLERFEAESGTDYFVGKFTTGDLSHLEVMRSLDLFATHVMDR